MTPQFNHEVKQAEHRQEDEIKEDEDDEFDLAPPFQTKEKGETPPYPYQGQEKMNELFPPYYK